MLLWLRFIIIERPMGDFTGAKWFSLLKRPENLCVLCCAVHSTSDSTECLGNIWNHFAVGKQYTEFVVYAKRQPSEVIPYSTQYYTPHAWKYSNENFYPFSFPCVLLSPLVDMVSSLSNASLLLKWKHVCRDRATSKTTVYIMVWNTGFLPLKKPFQPFCRQCGTSLHNGTFNPGKSLCKFKTRFKPEKKTILNGNFRFSSFSIHLTKSSQCKHEEKKTQQNNNKKSISVSRCFYQLSIK